MKVEGGRPGLHVPNSPHDLCGRRATFEEEEEDRESRALELCESRGGLPGLPAPNSPHDLCGRKATLNLKSLLHTSTWLMILMISVDVKQHRI